MSYTRKNGPWKLIHHETGFKTRADAMKREKFLKRNAVIIERLLLRRIYGRDIHIQLLLTFSVLLILDDLMKGIWGMEPWFVSEPYNLLGTFSVVGILYTWYDFVLVAIENRCDYVGLPGN